MAVAVLGTASAILPTAAVAQESLQPGEAYVTRFSGTVAQGGRTVINPQGTVGSIIDLRPPGGPPQGEHWWNEPQRSPATADQVGQVFGIALDDSTPPRIFLSATSAFGLHRTSDNADWMPGMWGQGGGPGSVYVLDPANGLRPRLLANITLDGRTNTGAALGNIAFDRWNKQLYVSDLETGMIHRLRASDGADIGRYDHGVAGRTGFFDIATGRLIPLPSVAFNPSTAARVSNCSAGAFSATAACYNFADFRRRVWGLGVRRDPASGEVRLLYSVWGSESFGNPEHAAAGDDQRNSVWSIRIGENGDFDLTAVRREFFLPDFFRSPEAIARSGRSRPVTDIAFPAFGSQTVMLVAERGGVRNLGLEAENAFARPYESRVLRYELRPHGNWELAGRYDVGYDDRKDAGPPYIRAGASGGVSFGMGYGESWGIDTGKPDAFAWMTGDGLCSPRGLCFDRSANTHNNSSQVHGLLGRAERPYEAAEPVTAFDAYPAQGPMTPAAGPNRSFMIDTDLNVDANDVGIEAELRRNDATRIGDVAVYQIGPAEVAGIPAGMPPAAEALPPTGPGAEFGPPMGYEPAPLPPDGWPIPPPLVIDTDLRIQKAGPAQCQAGVNCAYTLTITNVDLVPYSGPLAIDDTMPPGATLAAASAGWHCDVAGANVRCHTLGAASLNVGASASLTLTILLPAAVPAGHVTNCVAIDWAAMGTDDGPGDANDSACVDTPVTQGFDLGLQKAGPPQCVENAVCSFVIIVTNHGPGQFSGPLAVRDQLPPNTTLAGNSANWSCVQNGAEVECQRPAITLPLGGSTGLNLQLKLPDGIAGTAVQNCAQIDWAAMGANDGAADAHADDDCHTVNVIDNAGFFDLSIKKTGPAHCNAGGLCTYTIAITNNGPDTYGGHTAIRDTPPAGATFVAASAGFACVAGVTIDCDHPLPVILPPGATRTFTLTVLLPAPIPVPAVLNCVAVRWGPPFMPPNDNPPGPGEQPDSDCIWTGIGNGFDIRIAKAGPVECYEGHVCEYTVGLTNQGPHVYNGILVFDDTLPAGAVLESATGAMSCQPLGAPGTVTCNVAGGALPPGATRNVTLRVRLPDPVAGNTVTNCASMRWAPVPPGFPGPDYTADDNAGNDGPACVTTPILAADLAPFGGTTCQRGATCNLDVRIENRGARQFQGSAGLRGTLDPAVSITSITGQTPGLSCSVTGNGRYECRGERLSLKPGDAARLRLSIAIPANFAQSRIFHRKEMLWPDLRVKDRRPENDRHVSTILIEQPGQTVIRPRGSDLLVRKTGPATCTAGGICRYTVEVVNQGPDTYRGGLYVFDTYPGYLSSTFVSASPDWACFDDHGAVECRHGAVELRSGESVTLTIEVRLADDIAGMTETRAEGGARNCVRIGWPGEYSFDERTRNYWIERVLVQEGYLDKREVDGAIGLTERRAIREYQSAHGLRRTGFLNDELWASMFPGGMIGDPNRSNDNACIVTPVTQPIPPMGRPAVPPPVTPVCAGGRLSGMECICPQGALRKETGPNAFACVQAPTPPAEAQCIGGQTLRGQCVCPRGTELQQTATNVFSCVRPTPTPSVTCSGGRVVDGECICPQDMQRNQTATNVFACVRVPQPEPTPVRPMLNCVGGEVQRGQCICPPGTNRQQTATNVFTCVRVPVQPTLTCSGGQVQRGQCICPAGTTRKQISRNVFSCVKAPTPSVTCSGGRVVGGQCICPRGTNRRQTATNVFVCAAVPTIKPPPTRLQTVKPPPTTLRAKPFGQPQTVR